MMNWLFSKPKNNLPEPTALQAQRAKQIDQLKTFNQNVSEIHRNVEYRVNFIVNGSSLSLYITLPPQFPEESPSVRISPPVRHTWVNDLQIITGCPGLNNFVVHSDVGKIIRSMVEEFQRNPPVMLQQPYAPPGMSYPIETRPSVPAYTPYPDINLSAPTYMAGVPTPTIGVAKSPPTVNMQKSPSGSSYNSLGQKKQISSSTAPSVYEMPMVPTSFQALKDLSVQEMQQLADDEDAILKRIKELPQLETILLDRQNLFDENESLAKENVSKKPMLEESKRVLLEKYDTLNDLRQRFDEKEKAQDGLRQKFHPLVLQEKLKMAASEAEEEAEAIAESFLDGSISVDQFHKRYMEIRKLSYLRKAKEEKLTQYIVRGGF